MKFNIFIVKPDGYIYADAFLELGELLHYSLIELGHDSSIKINHIDKGAINIIIGCHLLSLDLIPNLQSSTIILNTEQLEYDEMGWNSKIFAWASKYETWDYSPKNINYFHQSGVTNVRHFKLGFQKELQRLNRQKKKDIDILFYGCINQRRKEVLNSLVKTGLNLKILSSTFGAERDSYVERSKLVLNLHLFQSEVFEVVRVFYLLTNGIAVVGEINPTTSLESRFLSGFFPSKKQDLVESCIRLVNDHQLRMLIQEKAIDCISQYPQSTYTDELLGMLK